MSDVAVVVAVVFVSYHKRPRLISETLELHMEDGRVSRIWCICVVSHGHGWLGGGRN